MKLRRIQITNLAHLLLKFKLTIAYPDLYSDISIAYLLKGWWRTELISIDY